MIVNYYCVPNAVSVSDSMATDFKSTTVNSINPQKMSPYESTTTHGLTLSNREIKKIMNDISQNGINESIKYVKYNGGNYVIDGHHRLAIAKRIGISDVPVMEVQLPYKNYYTYEDLFW